MHSYENKTIEEDMVEFQNYNVGGLNSGWHEEITESGDTYYYYINVEGVVSDTLEIRRNMNIVQAEIPNLYGVGINLDLTTGLLKLLGRESVVLSEQQLALGSMISSIESDNDAHTITFKFTNQEDLVLNVKDIIGSSDYYTKDEINEMFNEIKVKTRVIEDSEVEFEIINNSDTTFTSVETARFIIPGDVVHGYSAAVSIKFNVSEPNVEFINNSQFVLKFIMNGAVIERPFWNNAYQYELLILCDGTEIKAYVQEIES